MNCFSQEQLSRISHLIKEIEKLSDIEKLFLYLQLPCGRAESLEGKSKLNGRSNSELLAKKPDQETTQTYTWILSHLEEDSNVSLPKQEVYDEYRAFCQTNRFEPLCVADFGKAMKHAFPCIKPRRLGQRGNSRYCYSGLRKKYKIQPPTLPDLIEPTFCIDNDCSQAYNQIIKECRENPSECVLNDCGVMNLKVESHNSNANYSCTDHENGFSYHVNDGNQNKLDNNGIQPDPAMLNNNDSNNKPRITNQLNSNLTPLVNFNYQQHHHHQNHQQQQQQQPQQLQQNHHQPSMPPLAGTSCSQLARYSTCPSESYMPRRTGTPDDDDYSHNYLGSTPMDCHMAIGSLPIYQGGYSGGGGGGTGGDTAVQAPASSGNNAVNFLYPQPSTSDVVPKVSPSHGDSSTKIKDHPSNADHSTSAMSTGATQSQCTIIAHNNHHPHQLRQQFSRDNTNSMPSASSISGSSIASAHQLSNIYNSSIDFCASPFQSPASTPYPVMGNYLSDISDCCLNNDCVRYVDQQQ